jgi:chaperonin cofactor prefoldin
MELEVLQKELLEKIDRIEGAIDALDRRITVLDIKIDYLDTMIRDV